MNLNTNNVKRKSILQKEPHSGSEVKYSDGRKESDNINANVKTPTGTPG